MKLSPAALDVADFPAEAAHPVFHRGSGNEGPRRDLRPGPRAKGAGLSARNLPGPASRNLGERAAVGDLRDPAIASFGRCDRASDGTPCRSKTACTSYVASSVATHTPLSSRSVSPAIWRAPRFGIPEQARIAQPLRMAPSAARFLNVREWYEKRMLPFAWRSTIDASRPCGGEPGRRSAGPGGATANCAPDLRSSGSGSINAPFSSIETLTSINLLPLPGHLRADEGRG